MTVKVLSVLTENAELLAIELKEYDIMDRAGYIGWPSSLRVNQNT